MDTQSAVTQILAATDKVASHVATLAEVTQQLDNIRTELQAARAELAAAKGAGPDLSAAVNRLTAAVFKGEAVVAPAPAPAPASVTEIPEWNWWPIASEGQPFTIAGAPRYVRYGWGGVRWIKKLMQGDGVASVEFFNADPLTGVKKSAQVYRTAANDVNQVSPVPVDERLLPPAGKKWVEVAKLGEMVTVGPQPEFFLYGTEDKWVMVAFPPGTWKVSEYMTSADVDIGNTNQVLMRLVSA